MAFIILLLSGCQADPEQHGYLHLIDPEPGWMGEVLGIRAGIDFQPGPRVIEALEHGVTVQIRVMTRVGPPWRRMAISDDPRSHRFELRYLPLVQHFELTDQRLDTQTTYPRLSMLLQELRRPRWIASRLHSSRPDGLGWRLQAKVEIDRTRLPSPMRLPVWFDRNWGLGEPWRTWHPEQYGVR